jgi:hypothetical protein
LISVSSEALSARSNYSIGINITTVQSVLPPFKTAFNLGEQCSLHKQDTLLSKEASHLYEMIVIQLSLCVHTVEEDWLTVAIELVPLLITAISFSCSNFSTLHL